MTSKSAKQAKSQRVQITLTRSLLGRPDKHRRVAKALGLKKLHSKVEQYTTPTIQGMLDTIPHLIAVEVLS